MTISLEDMLWNCFYKVYRSGSDLLLYQWVGELPMVYIVSLRVELFFLMGVLDIMLGI